MEEEDSVRDKKLLEELLMYLKVQDQRSPFGRVIRRFITRISDEIAADPNEMARLCSTLLYLYDSPSTDCQPSKAWEKLVSKVRFALAKKRHVPEEEDPMVAACISIFPDTPEQDHVAYHATFGKQGLP